MKRGDNKVDAIRVDMPYGPRAIVEKIRNLTDKKKWFYMNNQAMLRLKEDADDVQEISNLVKIHYRNLIILAGPHTVDWWRVYAIEGEVSFREESNPNVVVFMEA